MRRVPWLALGTLAVWSGLWLGRLLGPLLPWLPGCAFKRLTGLACATCGLTRCALALGQQEWKAAFYWHPLVALLVLLLPALSMWDLYRAWWGAPYPLLPNSRVSRLAVWGLLLGAWALQVARGI